MADDTGGANEEKSVPDATASFTHDNTDETSANTSNKYLTGAAGDTETESAENPDPNDAEPIKNDNIGESPSPTLNNSTDNTAIGSIKNSNQDQTQSIKSDSTEDNPAVTSSAEATADEVMKENVHYEGDVAIYTDPETNYQYTWCTEKEEWVPRENITYGFEDDTHTYTDTDGVKYFWDKEKNAWFPKIDDNFMALYQLNYGFIDNTQPEVEKPKIEDKKEKVVQAVKHKAPPQEPTWFEVDDKTNTNVYVSNLPLDMKEEEFVDLMQKCGLVMRDGSSGKMKVKMYTEPETKLFKGDALCTYIRVESVDLAFKLLDGSEVKGNKIKVELAKFQMKGKFDPTLKPKKRKRKEKEKVKRMQEKLFDWRPERMRGERAKHEKVVIVKNVFESSMFDVDASLILEFQQDLREECSKCGEVKKVIIYDMHPEGVAQVNMKEPEAADAVVQLLNCRWFGKRLLRAEIWDGKTKYKIAETDSQISKRIDNWEKFLEDEEQKSSTNNKPEDSAAVNEISKIE